MLAADRTKARNLRHFASACETAGTYNDQWAAGEAMGAAILIEEGRDPAETMRQLSAPTLLAFGIYCSTR